MAIFATLSQHQRQMLGFVRRTGSAPRSALAQQAGLTAGAVTAMSRDLIERGLLREARRGAPAAAGRPTVPLEIDPGGAHAFGVSLRPGNADLLCVDLAGTPLARRTLGEEGAHPDRLFDCLRAGFTSIGEELGHDPARGAGLGVALAGYRVADAAWMRTVAMLESWRDAEVLTAAERALEMPVWTENVANAAALGEYYSGRWASFADLMFINVGHGVGAGLILDGKLRRGRHGNAGEIGGLFPLDRPRPSLTDLHATLAAAGTAVQPGELIEFSPDSPDPVIAAWIDRAAGQLVEAMRPVVAWIDPDCFVIGGALSRALAQQLVEAVQLRSAQPEHTRAFPDVRVFASTLGPDAAALGSAHLPLAARIFGDSYFNL